MKVLQINATYDLGSTGCIVKDIGQMLEKNGHEAFFAFQRAQNAPNRNSYCIGNIFDWKLHACFSRVFGKQSYYSFYATKRLIRWISVIHPDIVHLHNLHSNYINIKLILSYLSTNEIPTVITMHDCWYFTGKCFHYVDVNCDGFMRGCGNCPKKKFDPQSWFFDKSSRMLNDKCKSISLINYLSIVGCSQWICNEAKKSLIAEKKIVKIYNGVDISVFKPQYDIDLVDKLGVVGKRVILGMANKWLLQENRNLLNSLNEANDDIVFVIVGCTKNDFETLRALGKKFIPIGFIEDKKQLAKYYSIADVFVNLTHADTCPTVNMESICCGTPVITYDIAGSSELVLSGCGKVISYIDEDQMKDAILHYSNDKKNEISQEGKTYFNKENSYLQYLFLYQELLKKYRGI